MQKCCNAKSGATRTEGIFQFDEEYPVTYDDELTKLQDHKSLEDGIADTNGNLMGDYPVTGSIGKGAGQSIENNNKGYAPTPEQQINKLKQGLQDHEKNRENYSKKIEEKRRSLKTKCEETCQKLKS